MESTLPVSAAESAEDVVDEVMADIVVDVVIVVAEEVPLVEVGDSSELKVRKSFCTVPGSYVRGILTLVRAADDPCVDGLV